MTDEQNPPPTSPVDTPPGIDPAALGAVINRLRRAEGQLAGVVRMLQEGRSCEAVVTQLSAVSKALDRAGFALIASSLQQCLTDPKAAGSAPEVAKLEKLFLSLA